MDVLDTIWLVVFLGGLAFLVFARSRLRHTKRVFIPDYQRGVRFKNGIFVDVLGPGSFDSYTPTEQIVIVDMRPQPLVVERLLYKDALRMPSVISLGAELTVSDPYQACTVFKDQINESITVVREAARTIVSKSIADTAADARQKIASAIESAANVELDKSGLRVSKLEITELWSRHLHPRVPEGAN